MPPASIPMRPSWLSAVAYRNILNDKATPKDHRLGALAAISICRDAKSGKAAFDKYFSTLDLPPASQDLSPDSTLGHLFFARGFFKRVAEALGSGDEDVVAENFAILRDEKIPRRERRKVLKRLDRAMRGKPIRSSSPIWLYRDPPPSKDATAILEDVDTCLPWKLALPHPAGEFLHFTFPAASVAGGCRTPNCTDPGFDYLHIWKHGGKTNPPRPCPQSCGAVTGLKEVVAPSVTYETRIEPLGYCLSASLP